MLLGPQGGLLAFGAFVGGGLYHRFLMPPQVKALEQRITALEEKAKKYDALMEELADAQLSKLER